jgi:SAM-dependent methyltransferase
MTLPTAYFDDLYAASSDPWGFTDRWYETRKRALTLALLPDPTYSTVYEPGCSIGVLTRELAARCGQLLATDVSATAVAAARERCADLPHVTVEQAALPHDWPAAEHDLVLLSELGYYFSPEDLDDVAAAAMRTGRTVVAVHWRHDVDDYPQGGDAVHAQLCRAAASAGLRRLGGYADDDLLADVWSRDPRSAAARDGLR